MKYIVKLFGMICMYLRDKSTNNLCSSSSANSVNFLLLLTNKVAFCWFNLTEQEPRIFNSLSAISDSMNSLVSSGKTSKAFLKLDTKLESFCKKSDSDPWIQNSTLHVQDHPQLNADLGQNHRFVQHHRFVAVVVHAVLQFFE